jgi:hypothetical protein
MRKYALIGLCLWWTSHPARAQAQAVEPCQQMLVSYLKSMSRHAFPHQNEWYHLRLRVSSYPRQGSSYARVRYAGENLDVDIRVGKEAIFYESNYLAMYQDLHTVLTVVHPQKTIICSKADARELPGKSILAQHLANGQQQWLEGASWKSCRDTLYEGKWTKIMAMKPTARPGATQPIGQITYYFTPSERKLQRQVIEYQKDYPVARQVITFLEMDFDYRGKHSRTAYEQVFTGRQKSVDDPPAKRSLQSKYRSYQVKVQ